MTHDKQKKLAEVASIFNGKTPSKSEQRTEGHPVLKIRDVSEHGEFRGKFESFVDINFAQKYSQKFVQTGDTLVLNAAHNADYVGSKTFRAQPLTFGALATGEWLVIRPRQTYLVSAYLNHWVNFQPTRRRIREMVKGIHLYPRDVSRLEIPLPPLAEQRRIADILDKADALRAQRRAALAELDTLTQSIFLDLFGESLNKGCKQVELQDVAEVVTGYPFRSEEYVVADDSINLCRGANVLPGRIDWSDLACWPSARAAGLAEFQLFPGDVIVAMDRPWISEGFKIARMRSEDCPALLVQRVARVRGKDGVSNEFLFYLLSQPGFARHCRPTETTIPHISPKEIRSFPFFLPSRSSQHDFARRITAIESLKSRHRAALSELDALFASLQHRAFRGEL